MKKFWEIVSVFFTVGLFGMLLFYLAQWLGLNVGQFSDWIMGLLMFAWLVTIVVVPWNIYFEAKQVLDDGALSQEKGITVKGDHLQFVQKIAKRALGIAIFLHLASAGGFFALSHYGYTSLGYIAAGAALLLTLLRPAARFYEYISERLRNIRETFVFPRDDVYEMRNQVQSMDYRLKNLETYFNREQEDAWILQQEQQQERWKQQVRELRQQLDQLEELQAKTKNETQKELQRALSDLNREGKFMDQFVANLVEVVRFIKKA
jgi:hypothetical protein